MRLVEDNTMLTLAYGDGKEKVINMYIPTDIMKMH